MSNLTTIARPYAKAVFECALAHAQLSSWSDILHHLALVSLDEHARRFMTNPRTTPTQKKQFMRAVLDSFPEIKGLEKQIENLIDLLIQNKRMMLLPGLSEQYEALRAEHEKTLTAQVTSYSPLTQAQQAKLIELLSARLQRQITLDIKIEKSLLGGAMIRAGDFVIDGSVRGQLTKLGTDLAA